MINFITPEDVENTDSLGDLLYNLNIEKYREKLCRAGHGACIEHGTAVLEAILEKFGNEGVGEWVIFLALNNIGLTWRVK